MSPLFVLMLLFFVAVSMAAIAVEEGVLVLTDKNFDEAMREHSKVLIEFYAPWCGHCKSLAPEYAKAAGQLTEEGSSFKLAKVDATVEKKLAKDFEIKGFPTLKYFVGGKLNSEYSGSRDAAGIVAWANKKSGPAAVVINDQNALDAHTGKNSVLVVGAFSSEADAKQFDALADSDELNKYVRTSNAALIDSLGGEGVHVLTDFQEPVMTPLNANTATWIAGNSVPLIQEFSQESSKKIFASPIQKHVLFFTNKGSDHHSTVKNTFMGVAKDYKGKFLFVNVPLEGNERVLEYFGFQAADLPKMVVADMSGEGGMKKFIQQSDLTAANIDTFLSGVKSGEAKPTLKTETYDAADEAEPVKVLKGESFDRIVIDNTNDVLVEFYAPWCGHCKKLSPIYDELAEKAATQFPNVKIAKMDATANEIDVAGVNVKGFPTLYYFPANNKKNPVKYEGGRELADFIQFLGEHATVDDSRSEL